MEGSQNKDYYNNKSERSTFEQYTIVQEKNNLGRSQLRSFRLKD